MTTWLSSSVEGAEEEVKFRRLKRPALTDDEQDLTTVQKRRRLKKPRGAAFEDDDDYVYNTEIGAPLVTGDTLMVNGDATSMERKNIVSPTIEINSRPAAETKCSTLESASPSPQKHESRHADPSSVQQEMDYLKFRAVTCEIKETVSRALGGASHVNAISSKITRGRCAFTKTFDPPTAILRDNPELKPYQVAAVHWLLTLFRNRLNGLVADDMGLGKSAECICFLKRLYLDGMLTLPTVIACPTTLLDNWTAEFRKWAPQLRVLKYHGTQSERRRLMRKWETGLDEEDGEDSRDEEEAESEAAARTADEEKENESPNNGQNDGSELEPGSPETETPGANKLPVSSESGSAYHILVTTHGILSNTFDRQLFFKCHDFGYMVVDEAHTLKNSASQRYQQMNRSINAPNRLLLTGSPVQNQISELRNLLTFLNPYRHASFDLDRALQYHCKVWRKAVQEGRKANRRSGTETPSLTETSSLPDTEKDKEKNIKSPSEESPTAETNVARGSSRSIEITKGEIPENSPPNQTPKISSREPESGELSHPERMTDGRPFTPDLKEGRTETTQVLPRDVKETRSIEGDTSSGSCQVEREKVDAKMDDGKKDERLAPETETGAGETSAVSVSDGSMLPLSPADSSTSTGNEEVNARDGATDPEIMFYQQLLAPLILRRLKAEVIDNFPRKTNKIEFCDMTPLQRELYDTEMLSARPLLNDVSSLFKKKRRAKQKKHAEGGQETETPQAFIKGLLFRLRRICNHPLLFQRYFDSRKRLEFAALLKKNVTDYRVFPIERVLQHIADWSDFDIYVSAKEFGASAVSGDEDFKIPPQEFLKSCKILRMLELVDDLVKTKKQKVLIFSQFTTYLDIIQEVFFLHRPTLAILRLDGKTAVDDRSTMVSAFQAEDSDYSVFLLSTKAGGVGLNLTKANTVLLMDQDWNPHNDRQAEDRVHRLGQTEDVTVYRLCCRHSFEEAILSCCKKKLELDEAFGGNTESLPLEIFENMISSVQSYQPLTNEQNDKPQEAIQESAGVASSGAMEDPTVSGSEDSPLVAAASLRLRSTRKKPDTHPRHATEDSRRVQQAQATGGTSKTRGQDSSEAKTSRASKRTTATTKARARSKTSDTTPRAQRRSVLLPGGDSDDE